jgi:hypothetical protein
MDSALSPTPSTTHPLHRSVSPEALWMVVICMADLITTLYWINQGYAREGNPFMAWVLSRGHVPFIAVKILSFLPAVALAEWRRHERPRVRRIMRWAIVFYLFLYATGIGAHYGKVLQFYTRLLLS